MSSSYSINFSAVLSATSGDVAVGDVLCRDSTGYYTPITEALLAAGYFAEGISRTNSTSGGAVDVQSHGPFDEAQAGLGAGPADFVSFSAVTHRLVRGTVNGQIGQCSALGNGILYFGAAISIPATPAPTLASITPSLGDVYGDIPVTIAGAYLTGASSVTIGGVVCTSVVVVSSTRITARTPAKTTGTYDVAVTTAGGTGGLANSFEYWDPTSISGARVYDGERDVTQVSGKVSQWDDQGAAAKDLAQATVGLRPPVSAKAFGPRQGLTFDGDTTDRFLHLSAKETLATGKSIFFVTRHIATDNDHNTARINPRMTVVGDDDGSTYAEGGGFSAGEFSASNYDDGAAAWQNKYFSDGFNDSATRLYGHTHDSSSGDVKAYANGVQIGTTQNSQYNTSFVGWKTVGVGLTDVDGFNGLLAAVVVVPSVISSADRAKLSTWAQGKWGEGYRWEKKTDSAAFTPARDGAGLVWFQNKLWLLGGWNTLSFEGGTVDTTNEVWSSTDGVTWILELAHSASPPTSGAGARWRRRHQAGWVVHTHAGTEYIYVIGGDHLDSSFPLGPGDVWRSSDGTTWERVTDSAPCDGRVLHAVATFGGNLYVMGGQADVSDPTTALQDMWKSTDGGATWTSLGNQAWAKRGVFSSALPTYGGYLYLIGGGTYHSVAASRTYYSDVWKWNGSGSWTQVAADGSPAFAKRQYHNMVVFDSKLWVLGGFNASGNRNDVWWSTDGVTWNEHYLTPWAIGHADGVAVSPTAIWHAAGNALDQKVFRLLVGGWGS